jgi:hypothetical protein
MSDYFDPYDADRPLRLTCSCGVHANEAEHATAQLRQRSDSAEFEAYSNQFIEATLMKALFPQDAQSAAASCARWAGARRWPPSAACCPSPACRPWRRTRARWRRRT